jgi:hypothetical protein
MMGEAVTLYRLAPDPRGGRDRARPGGAGRAQAGSRANRRDAAGCPAVMEAMP